MGRGVERRVGDPHLGHADGDAGESVPADVEEVLSHASRMIAGRARRPKPVSVGRRDAGAGALAP